MNFEIVQLIQGSDPWRDWRREGITATDATVIAGVSPYVTSWRLCAEKLGLAKERDISSNPWVRRGNRCEADARDHMADFLYEMETPPDVRKRAAIRLSEPLEACCVQVVKHPVFRASLDGLRSNGEPTELKVPSPRTFASVKAHGRNSFAFKQYYPQVQHQILVTNAKRGWLMFYQPDSSIEPICFEIERDENWLRWYIPKARAFWAHKLAGSLPEKDPGRDAYYPTDESVAATWILHSRHVHRYEQRKRALKAQIAELEAIQHPHLEALETMMGGFKAGEYAGIRLTRSTRSKVDWPELVRQEFGAEATESMQERYRAQGKTSRRLTLYDEGMPREILDPSLREWIQNDVDEQGRVAFEPMPENRYF